MKIHPILLVCLVFGSAIFGDYLAFKWDVTPKIDTIKRLRQDSAATHTLLRECNGVISRANMDSSYFIKNTKR